MYSMHERKYVENTWRGCYHRHVEQKGCEHWSVVVSVGGHCIYMTTGLEKEHIHSSARCRRPSDTPETLEIVYKI